MMHDRQGFPAVHAGRRSCAGWMLVLPRSIDRYDQMAGRWKNGFGLHRGPHPWDDSTSFG
ncbi:MAG: hypothetical protein CMJ59_19900 [Planctomycetaceae bacterium]|nr:hypothetical protein [Planctomycetaceae bacterium]